MPRTRRTLLAGFAAGLLIAVVVFAATREGEIPVAPVTVLDPRAADPFAYVPERRAAFEQRAAAGFAHVLYVKSPGGAVATARRVAALRPLIDRVAARGGADAATLEAIVFLESAGRPDAVAGSDLTGAVGLTQILAETGRNLLAMRVDPAAARRLTRRIARARAAGRAAQVRRLAARRRAVDQRFDPRRSLEATVRYLRFAKGKLGRDDLAVASYHMGVGNLQNVIADFGRAGGDPRSYAELYFASSPTGRSRAWRRLSGLGDDSPSYLWRVLAARAIMRAYRSDPRALARTAALQTAKGSSEEVLHPRASTTVFSDAGALRSAYRRLALRTFPDAPRRLGLRRDPRMGDLAAKLGADRALYRGLRPEAYALAAYLAALTRRSGGGDAPLTVTSTVRDVRYQRALAADTPQATRGYSLHTTGWAFDVARRYRGRAQAQAFQFTLDRLAALNLIAWVREPAAIHLTVSSDARILLALLRPAG